MKNLKRQLPLWLLLCCICQVSIAQPVLMKTIPNGSTRFVTSEGRLFFTSGDTLWTSNGTPATTYSIKKVGETFVRMTNFRLGTFIYFTTLQSDGKTALWRSNGSGANTTKIVAYKTIEPLVVYNDFLFLGINDDIHGFELWKINVSNTLTMVKDIVPGSGSGLASDATIISSNIFYFMANAGPGGINLWKSDGTNAGTQLAADLPFTDAYLNNFRFTDVNGTIFFARNYINIDNYYSIAQLWVTNGTTAGTSKLLADSSDYSPYAIHSMEALSNKLYFVLQTDNTFGNVMISDGTVMGTVNVGLQFFDEIQTPFYKVDSRLVITSLNNNIFQMPLHKLDVSGNVSDFHEFDISSSQTNLGSTGKLLFFTDVILDSHGNPTTLDELYQSDLYAENTRPLKSIFGTSFAYSDDITPAGESIYFTTNPRISNIPFVTEKKLWFYDPTKPSTNVHYFTLVNADTDQDIQWLHEGDTIVKAVYPHINIRYNPAATPGSVVFDVDAGIYHRTENQAPYALAGDTGGDYNTWGVNQGNHTLIGTPYSGFNGSGTAGTPLTVHFTVRNATTTPKQASSLTISDNSIVQNIEVYPNPSSDYFNFSVLNKEAGNAKAQIYKMDGTLVQTIHEGNAREGQSVNFSWNGNGQAQGIYLCKYTCGSQQLTRKVVISYK